MHLREWKEKEKSIFMLCGVIEWLRAGSTAVNLANDEPVEQRTVGSQMPLDPRRRQQDLQLSR